MMSFPLWTSSAFWTSVDLCTYSLECWQPTKTSQFKKPSLPPLIRTEIPPPTPMCHGIQVCHKCVTDVLRYSSLDLWGSSRLWPTVKGRLIQIPWCSVRTWLFYECHKRENKRSYARPKKSKLCVAFQAVTPCPHPTLPDYTLIVPVVPSPF